MDSNSTKMAPSQTLGDYKATGFSTHADPSAGIESHGDLNWTTATGFSTHTAADVKTLMEAVGSYLTIIKTKTDSLKDAWNDPTAAECKATGFSTHDAAAVWAAVNRELSTPADYKATGFSTHSAAAVKTAMEADGGKLDHIWETTEDDAGVRRFTENALEEAPSGTSTGATAQEVWEYATRELSTPANYKADLSTLETRLSDTRAGYLDLIVDGGFGLEALLNVLSGMKGTTFNAITDSLEAIRNQGDAAWTTGAGGSSPTVEEIRTEMDTNSTKMAPSQVLADYKATGFATVNPPSSTLADYMADVSALALATVCTEVRLARLDAAISSRSSHGDPDPSGFIDVAISSRNDTTPPTTDAIKTKIEEVGSSMAGVKAKTDNLKDSWNDPTAEACKATGFSTHNAAAIWTATGRELSTPADYKADVLALATSAEIGLLNDITVANVETACDSAIDNAIASPTSGSLGYYMQKMFIAQVNKMVVTETNGNTEQFNDSNVTIGSIGGAITSDGTYTTRLRMVQ
jgi:hypothetical protein